MDEITIQHITMQMSLSNGEVVHCSMSDSGVSRWGASTASMWACVEPTEEIQRVLIENGHFKEDR